MAKKRRKVIPEAEQDIPAVASEPETVKEVFDPDLQTPIDAVNETPQFRAQMVRRAFGTRGWPNEEHPGTVRDFLIEYKIPIIGE